MDELIKFLRERDDQAREEAKRQQETLLKLVESIKDIQLQASPTIQLGSTSNSAETRSALILQSSDEFIEKQITPFVYAPKEGLTFDRWYERTNTVFGSDRGKAISESGRAAMIRSKLSQSDYQCFARTILPKKPEDLSLRETVKILTNLFGRQETIFALRHRVMQMQMLAGEDFRSYAARVNQAAEEFELGSFTTDDLKTQLFTQGLKFQEASAVRNRIMEKIDDNLSKRQTEDPPSTPKLKLDDLVAIANRMLLREEESKLVEQQPSTKQEIFAIGKGPCKYDCRHCGERHWHIDCPFRKLICTQCKIAGHKAGFCASSSAFNNRQKEKGAAKYPKKNGPDKIDSTCTPKTPSRKSVHPKINGVRLRMKHDSGSDWIIISRSNWQRLGAPKLTQPASQAVSASGDAVSVLGYFSAAIEIKDKFGIVDCYVSTRDLNLFGNSALEALNLWDQPITAYCDEITTAQSELIQEVRNKFPSLFSQSLGKCKLFKASIKLKAGARPPFVRARPVAFNIRDSLSKAYDELVEQGVFTPTNFASAAAPVVVVKKKDGSLRVTADYSTGLNRAIETFNHPLPTPESIFATLAGSNMFTTLDLSNAFHQIELDDEAKDLMAVNTHRGLYRVNRLQFGVKTAPSQFQQLMDSILAGSGASAYLDDVIVPGKGEREHKERLFEVLKRLEDAGLRLRLEKCKFGQPSIRFLGKIIDAQGQRPDPEKLQVIRDLPQPEDVSQLRAFLGAINWYGSFIPSLKDLRGPLDEMLRKEEKFEWNECRIKSFNRLKQALHADLALAHYDPSRPLVVAADASSYGVGAALMHRLEDGTLSPIQYAATTFNEAERRYSQVEREALALVYAVKKFHRYIYGRRFELQTDHKPLIKIFGSKTGIPVHSANRLLRYANTLLGYDFEVKYVDNASFTYADFVSRLIDSHAKPGAEDVVIADVREQEGDENTEQQVIFATNAIPLQLSDLQQATEECEHLKIVRGYIETHWPSIRKQVTNEEAAEYFPLRTDLRIVENCIFFGDRPIIPPRLRPRVLEELHRGHPGASRMNALAREKCFWPGISHQVASFVQHCQSCATNAKAPIKEVLHPWPIPEKPWQRLHIDFAGPVGPDYFLVVVDAHSNWPEVFRMRSTTTDQTCKALAEIFSRWGCCRTIVSDNGPQFTSSLFKDFCARFGINHITSAPYHPQSNGKAERFVDTLKRGLRKMEGEGDIDQKLNTLLATYRGTPCLARDGKSPFELMTGRKMPTRLDLLREHKPIHQPINQRMIKQFNNHHGARVYNYEVGDPIYCQIHRGNTWTWQAGTILERQGAATYLVHVDGRVIKAHSNQLKRRFTQNLPTILIQDDFSPSFPFIPQTEDTHPPVPEPRSPRYNEVNDEPVAGTRQTTTVAPLPNDSDSSSYYDAFEDAESDNEQELVGLPTLATRPRRTNAATLPGRFKDFLMDTVDNCWI